jgi:hypothetical protein
MVGSLSQSHGCSDGYLGAPPRSMAYPDVYHGPHPILALIVACVVHPVGAQIRIQQCYCCDFWPQMVASWLRQAVLVFGTIPVSSNFRSRIFDPFAWNNPAY